MLTGRLAFLVLGMAIGSGRLDAQGCATMLRRAADVVGSLDGEGARSGIAFGGGTLGTIDPFRRIAEVLR